MVGDVFYLDLLRHLERHLHVIDLHLLQQAAMLLVYYRSIDYNQMSIIRSMDPKSYEKMLRLQKYCVQF